jgi:hypothetical protein
MSAEQPPTRQGQVLRRDWPARPRPRDTTPAFDHADEFERQREAAEQYPCDQPPLGCGVPVGERCRVIGALALYLTRRPAHLGRLRSAGVAPPSVVGSGAPRDGDRPPGAPIPARNRSLYDIPADLPEEPPGG